MQTWPTWRDVVESNTADGDMAWAKEHDEAPACAVLSPPRFYLICERRDDGGLRLTCPEVPGLALSHADPDAVMRDVMPAIDTITRHNMRRETA